MRVLAKVLSLIVMATLVTSQCPDSNICTQCTVTGCKNCDSDVNACDTCLDGYYKDGTGCTECPTKCLICSINTYCDKCTPGYDREYDSSGNQICVFYWWKWFLIVFGTLIGLVIIGVLVWWVRNKLKDEEGERQVHYQMKNKLENTENNLKE